MKRILMRVLEEGWVPAALIALWWLATRGSKSFYFPSFTAILSTFRSDWLFRLVPTELVPSLEHLLAGLGIAIVLGLVGGVLIGASPTALLVLRPALEVARSCPAIVLIPIVIGVFGIGSDGKVFLTAFACVWPVLLNTIEGVRGLEPTWLDMSTAYRLRRRDRLGTVVLRGASPQIMLGIRVSLAAGVVMIVASEMAGASNGVGFYLLQAEQEFNVNQTWATTLLLGLLGYALSLLLRAVERRVLAWHIGMQRAVGSRATH